MLSSSRCIACGANRRAFWRRFLPLADLITQGFDPPGEDGRHGEEDRRRAERASRALATLPAVQREALVLHDLEGFSMPEIAVMQKVTVSAVKTRVARGREKLRAHYRRLGLGQAPLPWGSVSAVHRRRRHEA